ncbi:protein ACCELERATED CELL DEATH 6-like [Typha angustifolia]|uniref:protein ACCELERATED CELL DEATH 6-like n=1 Tax=Typha angustifolia TaxID=59011 RepID=UPI003C30D2D6
MRKKLFKLAMQDKWEEVIEIYKNNPQVQGENLTRAKGTTLHVAISAGKEDVALQLLLEVSKENVEKILKTKNETLSTPLHVAASHGMHRACWNMAERCPTLVTTERNRRGETPLFTAARHGKEDAFFALERWVQRVNPPPKDMRKRDVTHCRREEDGNSILHFAILGEYLGLANEIIEL